MATNSRTKEIVVTAEDAYAASIASGSTSRSRRASHGQASSRGAALARAALGELDSNATREDVEHGALDAMKALDGDDEDDRILARADKRARVTDSGEAARGVGLALPRAFQTLVDAYQAVLIVGRLLRVRQGSMTADVVCAGVQRTLGRRCTLDTLRRLEATMPGTISFRARTTSAEDLRRIHTDIAIEGERRVEDFRNKLLDVIARAHEGDGYVEGELPSAWREGFNIDNVPLPEPVDIAFMDEDSREGPSLSTENAASKATGASFVGVVHKISDSDVAKAMLDLGTDGEGLSEKAVRAALERKVAVEAFADPNAVAERARRKLYGRLPYVFDAVRSTFASSNRRVMEFDALMDTLLRTNARQSVAADELTDSVRILARACPEWCQISNAKHAGVELFRVVSKSAEVARAARLKLANLVRDL